MLAYVFWHWKAPEVSRELYEKALIEFQQTLATASPDGFRSSMVVRINGAPWLEATAEAYEDWYLLEGSYAMDILEEAAVSAQCKTSHDQAARMAAGGCAGLYRLRSGIESIVDARVAAWFAKPAGLSYQEFYHTLSQRIDAGKTGLWGRQMALGPTPEFCLLAPVRLDLPENFNAIYLPRDVVWPAS
jgi:hypothetical protein